MRIRIDYTVDLDTETIKRLVAWGMEIGYMNNGDGDKRNLSIVRRVLAEYGKDAIGHCNHKQDDTINQEANELE